MTLEEAITEAARNRGFRMSVFPASEGYQANLSDDGVSFRCEMAPDPLTALKKVLGLLPGASGPLRQPATPKPEGSVFE